MNNHADEPKSIVSGIIIIAVILLVLIAFALVKVISLSGSCHIKEEFFSSSLIPWQSIGGCGAGGSVTSGSSAMWIGRGISGSILDFEIRTLQSVTHANGGGTALLRSFSFPITTNLHTRLIDFNFLLPFSWKQKLVQVNDDAGKINQSGGIGDFSFGMMGKLGMEGSHNIIGSLTFPTGKSDIHDFSHKLISSEVQNGAGVFSASLGYDFNITRDWGMFIVGGSYTAGLFYLEHSEEVWDSTLERLVPEKKQLKPARISGTTSRNDMHVISPDYLSFHFYSGIKLDMLTHSFGLNGSIPLSEGSFRKYDYVVNPNDAALLIESYPEIDSLFFDDFGYVHPNDTIEYHSVKHDSVWVVRQETKIKDKQWFTLSPSYGMEIFNDFVPLFWAFSLPIEFNTDDGIGVSGFTLELGIKFRGF